LAANKAGGEVAEIGVGGEVVFSLQW